MTQLTSEQLKEARILIAKENGSKGGTSWWKSLSAEQRSERTRKMVIGRKRASIERKYGTENKEQL